MLSAGFSNGFGWPRLLSSAMFEAALRESVFGGLQLQLPLFRLTLAGI